MLSPDLAAWLMSEMFALRAEVSALGVAEGRLKEALASAQTATLAEVQTSRAL